MPGRCEDVDAIATAVGLPSSAYPVNTYRIDTFFAGKGYFGADRVRYIKDLASRGIKVQPTSIGSCTRNFELPVTDEEPPCYGDFECDPNCDNHVITERGGQALAARRDHALVQAPS